MKPTYSAISAQAMPLAFSHGFLLTRSSPIEPPMCDWAGEEFGPYALLHHATTVVTVRRTGNATLALVGWAYNSRHGIFDTGEIADLLLDHFPIRDTFFDLLDDLSGRFALFIWDGRELTVLHDAQGTRSVFYAEDATSGYVASHGDIIARITGAEEHPAYRRIAESSWYRQREVKYLPGLITPYTGIAQLTPNTLLRLPGPTIERYWPRPGTQMGVSEAEATARLVTELRGLATYLEVNRIRPVIGLTGGTDSRGILAATRHLDPFLFTFYWPDNPKDRRIDDVRFAAALADRLSLQHAVFPFGSGDEIDLENDPLAIAFRLATSGFRGPNTPLLQSLAAAGDWSRPAMHLCGIGGEVCRGFYQQWFREDRGINEAWFLRMYGLAGRPGNTERLFQAFIDRTQMAEVPAGQMDSRDLFYWEHRMGVWQSYKIGESDMVMPSMAAYNSRWLFSSFLGQPYDVRKNRLPFHRAVRELAPDIADAIEAVTANSGR